MADAAGHRHRVRFTLAVWPQQHLPRGDAAYNREKQKSLLGAELGTQPKCCRGQQGETSTWKAQRGLSKSQWKFFY